MGEGRVGRGGQGRAGSHSVKNDVALSLGWDRYIFGLELAGMERRELDSGVLHLR